MSGFVALRVVTLPPGRAGDAAALARALDAAAASLPGLRASWAGPVLPGVGIDAGDLVWRAVFASERDAVAAPRDAAWAGVARLLAGSDTLALGYRPGHAGAGAGGTVWRALIFRVMPHAPAALVERLRAETLLMPAHVGAIRSFALSEVASVSGPKAFTHVWEQEFATLDGLTGAYMNHPLHWGAVDRFFDADCPEYIVDPYLVQVAGAIDRAVIGGAVIGGGTR